MALGRDLLHLTGRMFWDPVQLRSREVIIRIGPVSGAMYPIYSAFPDDSGPPYTIIPQEVLENMHDEVMHDLGIILGDVEYRTIYGDMVQLRRRPERAAEET